MPIHALTLDLDPIVRLGDVLAVRWSTLALALVFALGLAVAGAAARRGNLRADDLLYVVIGAVPGAVLGGRIGYVVLVPEAFHGGPLGLFDPAIGGLELGLGVVGGILTGGVVAALLGAPLGAWADRLAPILLLVIAGAKAALLLDGSGQGALSSEAWAVAFAGPGPWGSTAAHLPAHPAQAYEALVALAAAVLVIVASRASVLRHPDGTRLAMAIGLWAVGRAVVSTTWRDPVVVGPLPAGGILAIGIALGAAAAVLVIRIWWPRVARARAAAAQPTWPDPAARPRF